MQGTSVTLGLCFSTGQTWILQSLDWADPLFPSYRNWVFPTPWDWCGNNKCSRLCSPRECGTFPKCKGVVGVWNSLFFLLERVFLSSGIVLGIKLEINRQDHSWLHCYLTCRTATAFSLSMDEQFSSTKGEEGTAAALQSAGMVSVLVSVLRAGQRIRQWFGLEGTS